MTGNIIQAVQRTGHVATVHEESLYIWGGYKESEHEAQQRYLPGSELLEYDPLFEQWFYRKCLGDIPLGTSGAVAVKLGSKLYCFGGYREDGNTNDLFSLDLKTYEWIWVLGAGPKPIPCDKMVGWEHNESLYFFGGFGLDPELNVQRPRDFSYVVDNQTPNSYKRGWNNQLVSFDLAKKMWSVPRYKGQAPVARAAHACAKVKNKVYIMGGRHLQKRMNDLHCFNCDTLEWSGCLEVSGEKPIERSWHSLTTLTDNYLLLYGGFSQENVPLSDCWLLDLSNLTWVQVDLPLNRPRLWHTASLLSPGELFICGGCSGNILNHNLSHNHTLEIIVLRFTPKSLLRLCMDRVVEYGSVLSEDWKTLPGNIQHILHVRTGFSSPQTRSLGGS